LGARSLFTGYRLGLTVVALFSFGINILMLTSAFYMFQVYDRVLVSRSVETLLYLTLVALIALATLGLLDMLRGRILVRLGAALEQRHSVPALARSVDAANAGQSCGAQRLSDLAQVRSFFGGPGVVALFDVPWVPIYIGVIYLLHPWLGHFTVLGAVVLLGLALLNERITHRLLKEAGLAAATVHRSSESIIRNSSTIDALGLMASLSTRWTRLFEASRRQQLLATDRHPARPFEIQSHRPSGCDPGPWCVAGDPGPDHRWGHDRRLYPLGPRACPCRTGQRQFASSRGRLGCSAATKGLFRSTRPPR
jgi:ABC-type protease/lipase transport system fused ATPase/permease subunit